MKLSASKAAEAVGKSIPTITRAIKSGRISAEPVEGGGWLIDPAELFRVFPALTANSNDTPSTLETETPNVTGVLEVELRMLRERLAEMQAAAERDRRDKDAVIDDLRSDRDHWRDQAALITRQLTAPKPQAVEPVAPGQPSLWQRVFRRSSVG